jgi:hypothetical protein
MKKLFLIILCLIIVGCHKSELDLSTIDLGADANKYNLDKISDLSIVPDSPKKDLINYFCEESKVLNYAKIPIDSSWSTHITVYKNKIASIEVHVKEKYVLDFAKKLIELHGKPTTIIKDNQNLDSSIKSSVYKKFKKVFPNDINWVDGEVNNITFPSCLFWEKDDSYYLLFLDLESSGRIRNNYIPITKVALRANIIFGYVYPIPKDSPLYNFLK